MRYPFVFFDLDGTLLNTLDDLCDSVNTVLTRHGLPCITREETAGFLGNGAGWLIHCALPKGIDAKLEKEILSEYKAYYAAHCCIRTAPFPGVMEMLSALQAAGARMAVVSNKPDGAVRELSELFFGALMEEAVGEMPEIRRKPAPDTIFEVMRRMDAAKEESVYIGDSEVDLEMAENCGLPCISVTWGFRSEEQLKKAGAKVLAHSAEELKKLLLG